MEVHKATLSLEEKATVLSVLLGENVAEQRRKLRKKLENGTKPTKEAESDLWFVRKVGEENAGIHDLEPTTDSQGGLT